MFSGNCELFRGLAAYVSWDFASHKSVNRSNLFASMFCEGWEDARLLGG